MMMMPLWLWLRWLLRLDQPRGCDCNGACYWCNYPHKQ